MTLPDDLTGLGVALALGLLVGIERGWHLRDQAEGTRVAGVRTFGLIGLLGGVAALLSRTFESPLLLGGAFVGFAILLTAGYVATARRSTAIGMTTEIAACLTFGFGAMAVAGHGLAAASATVAVLVLLRTKHQLHGWIARIREKEIRAGITLLLLTLVLLPLLPTEPIDPWGAVAPRTVLWMVILVAGLSFLGYVAVRVVGPRAGLLATGVLGGLASSTAVTLSLSRLARGHASNVRILAAGVVAASAIMPMRVLIVSSIVNRAMLPRLAFPVVGMAIGAVIACVLLLRRREASTVVAAAPIENPLELGTALRLAAVLVVIPILASMIRDRAGDWGVYVLSAVSGSVDVDAITLSLSRMADAKISGGTATVGVGIAVAANTTFKAVLAFLIGGAPMGRLVAASLGLSLALGAVGLLV